jgi:RNA polymerase sigma factor (sigma-70 family)
LADLNSREPDPAASRSLVERAQSGDAAALEDIVVLCAPLAFRMARRRFALPGCGQDPEDAAWIVLEHLVARLHRYDGRADFWAFFRRLARNKLEDLARRATAIKRAPRETVSIDDPDVAAELESQGPEPEQVAAGKARWARLMELAESLSEPPRRVLFMNAIYEMDFDEIAGATGYARGTVKNILSAAKQELKRLWLEQAQ